MNTPRQSAIRLIRTIGPEEAIRLVAGWRVEAAIVGEKAQANFWTQVLNELFVGVA